MITKKLIYDKLYSILIDLKILDAAFESIEGVYEWPLSDAHRNVISSISSIEDAINEIEIKTINDAQ